MYQHLADGLVVVRSKVTKKGKDRLAMVVKMSDGGECDVGYKMRREGNKARSEWRHSITPRQKCQL